jgi:AraC-like DNA-binding protein
MGGPTERNAACAELGFSPQYLCRAFKRAVGLTLKQYSQALRLDYARALLWGSGRSISEIATITGFADQSHLTRVLRQRSGQTPVKLRLNSFAPDVALTHKYRST